MRYVAPVLYASAIALATLVPVETAAPAGAHAQACYEIYGEVRNLGAGWAHIAVVENDCDYWLQCTVWTDVNPQPPVMVAVGPDETEKRQITAGSPQKEFKTYGTCRRQ